MESGNLGIMFSVAKSLLDSDGTIKKAMTEYETVDWIQEKDERKKAEAAYYLLHHIDKGEFSQALADCVASNNVVLAIPTYIQKAVLWACGRQNDDT
jgi:putative ATP-dependent endonuclease of the OLD family